MVSAQLRRLKRDANKLQICAKRLQKKENFDRMNKILKKHNLLKRRIAEEQSII